MSGVSYQEAQADSSLRVQDMQRAIKSLMEELDAVDFYHQQVEACTDPALKALLARNRDEENEHVSMLLQWIRRNDDCLDEELREYLFSNGEIAHL
ncbi:MAG: ferritin [Pseudomonadales bacterium]